MGYPSRRRLNGLLWAVLFMATATPSIQAAGLKLGGLKGLAVGRIGGYLKATGQETLSINTETDVPPVPEHVYWDRNAEQRDLFKKWGVDVDLSGLKLTVKLGFIRSGFDDYTQAYKVEPVVSIIDNTIDGRHTICPYLRKGEDRSYRWEHPGVDVGFQAKFDGASVEITHRDWKTGGLYRTTVSYDQLLSSWLPFARQNCGEHLGNPSCLIPQGLWRDESYQFGWLTGEGTPLYYTTGMPQDFVELFRMGADGRRRFKPKASSLPMQVAFVLSPYSANRWEMRQMTSDEYNDALLEGKSAISAHAAGAVAILLDDANGGVK